MKPNLLAQRVASNVRAEMARAGFSQSTLARRMGRTQQYLSRRVAGHVPFDVADLADIANYLNTPVEILFQAAPTVAASKK